MARYLGLASRLRDAGLKVVEISGWQTRGPELNESTKTQVISVAHHTAGARSGNAPSLNICIYGRSDLPGPLCNVLLGRDNTCYVIAAGKTNNAGPGSWKGLTGNGNTLGLEVENVGTSDEPWTRAKLEAVAKILWVFQRFTSQPSVGRVCHHKEWAPNRKTDMHTITGTRLREYVTAAKNNQNEEISMGDITKILDELQAIKTELAEVKKIAKWAVWQVEGREEAAKTGRRPTPTLRTRVDNLAK